MERLPRLRPIVGLVLRHPVEEVTAELADELHKIESRIPVENSDEMRTLGVALEKVIDANLIIEVNPFVAVDDPSLNGNAV